MDLVTEQAFLVQAQAHVARARVLIEEQRARVARLERSGAADAAIARDLLQAMRDQLAAAEEHRDLIVANVARIRAGKL